MSASAGIGQLVTPLFGTRDNYLCDTAYLFLKSCIDLDGLSGESHEGRPGGVVKIPAVGKKHSFFFGQSSDCHRLGCRCVIESVWKQR